MKRKSCVRGAILLTIRFVCGGGGGGGGGGEGDLLEVWKQRGLQKYEEGNLKEFGNAFITSYDPQL